jgi:endonuclease/exonuclease/phosphatase family metal-dependent hydrolase
MTDLQPNNHAGADAGIPPRPTQLTVEHHPPGTTRHGGDYLPERAAAQASSPGHLSAAVESERRRPILTESAARQPATTRTYRIFLNFAAGLACVFLALLAQGCAGPAPVRPRVVYQHLDFCPCQPRTISIGTYNLERLADLEELARTLRALDFIDIWVFQEVNKEMDSSSVAMGPLRESSAPDRLRSILPRGHWYFYYVPVNPADNSRLTACEGQAIASRYPLCNKQVWWLCATGEKRRAALACEVVISTNTSVFVINTDHEVAFTSIGPDDRQQQVDDLITNIDQNPSLKSKPVILLGDFNTIGKPLQCWLAGSRKEIRNLRKSLGEIGLEPLPETEVPFPTIRWLCFPYAVDHVFLRNADCCRWGITTNDRGSDHHPLWVTIRTNE